MNIAILGAGAMGSLFGGYLSIHNEVWMVDVNAKRVNAINEKGVSITENDCENVFTPKAVVETSGLEAMDLIIVFVKAMFTNEALSANRHLIGKQTYIMTLQNGAGHETKLLQFTDKDHVLIGTTQHNSSIISDGHVHHGGGGKTTIGILGGNSERIQHIADNFCNCAIETVVSNEVKKQIWTKLFINTAASSLTAILQVPLGFILDNPYACSIMEQLAQEAVAVANAEGIADFDSEEVIKNITSDPDYKSMTLDEAQKYGKTFEHFNARFEVKEMGVKYDYSVCNDPVYNKLKAQLTVLEDEIKAREKYLKAIPTQGVQTLLEDEVLTLYPPAKSSTTSITVNLK